MCGIVGILSRKREGAVAEADLIRMRDTMQHRGPDDAGVCIHNENGIFVGLGHRRLSIIDLSPLGHQPMSTADGRLWVTFNGEIFNFQTLRDQLENTGKYVFRSRTDTEVILYSILEWGIKGALERFRGMYAFGLYDTLEKSLTLVRDPLGIKPLYYYIAPGTVVFASEIKAILALPGFTKEIDYQSLYHYLTFASSPGPDTLFKHIRKLEAGTYLTFDRNGYSKKVRYWDPARFQPSGSVLSEEEAVSEIRQLLRQAIARRMIADVPFGVFLSGGLDSSLTVALMAEMMHRPVQTFSIGIEGDPSNEFAFAHRTAQRFSTNHHELFINDEDFISLLPEIPYYQDEPLADPVCVPLYYVSKLARASNTPVIQIGEGSDEIFAGYEMYHRFYRFNRDFYRFFLKTPTVLKTLLYKVARGSTPPYISDMLRRASSGETLFIGNAIAFWDDEKCLLLCNEEKRIMSSSLIHEIERSLATSDYLASIIQVELKNRLPELLLTKVDKMSMAHAIETRVPFLDEDLVEFALSIPSNMKYRDGIAKYILKKAAEGFLPWEIIYRKKWGFCGSATNMVTPKIAQFARQVILDSTLAKDYLNRDYVERIFKSYLKQKRFNSFKIWNLMNLALWYLVWFE